MTQYSSLASAKPFTGISGAKCEIVQSLVQQGMPVCGNLGLLPQSINLLGGLNCRVNSRPMQTELGSKLKKLYQAGVGLLVSECIPAELAR